jgi:GNAT superfamily N-acetyltransferase
MYVRPEARKRDLGRALLNRLVAVAGQIGYERLRLDSAWFMKAAQIHPAHQDRTDTVHHAADSWTTP